MHGWRRGRCVWGASTHGRKHSRCAVWMKSINNGSQSRSQFTHLGVPTKDLDPRTTSSDSHIAVLGSKYTWLSHQDTENSVRTSLCPGWSPRNMTKPLHKQTLAGWKKTQGTRLRSNIHISSSSHPSTSTHWAWLLNIIDMVKILVSIGFVSLSHTVVWSPASMSSCLSTVNVISAIALPIHQWKSRDKSQEVYVCFSASLCVYGEFHIRSYISKLRLLTMSGSSESQSQTLWHGNMRTQRSTLFVQGERCLRIYFVQHWDIIEKSQH